MESNTQGNALPNVNNNNVTEIKEISKKAYGSNRKHINSSKNSTYRSKLIYSKPNTKVEHDVSLQESNTPSCTDITVTSNVTGNWKIVIKKK